MRVTVKNDTDETPLRIAAFLAQALDLDDDPATLAGELIALKQDPHAGIWTVELDSSVGPAAFLIYRYLLAARSAEGRTGREHFDADRSTLEQAAERNAPGPRIAAHAVTDDEAFILATTPATWRALAGSPGPEESAAAAPPHLPPAESSRRRREAAAELMRLLHTAERHAQTWLDAIRAEGLLPPAAADADEVLEFNEEETALALFLLDDRSIQHLLRVLNLMIDSARRQAAAIRDESPPERRHRD